MVTLCSCGAGGSVVLAKGRFRRPGGPEEALTSQPDFALAGVLRIPESHVSPGRAISRRLALALLALLAAVIIVYLDRDGYHDVRGGRLSLLDCVYYATVSLSTIGYGDITPYTESARLMNVLIITPLRVAFLIVLVGTTLEVLTERSRQAWKIQRWRSRVRNHTIVVGYGAKGRTAIDAMLGDGVPPADIVVVDTDQTALDHAAAAGLVRARQRHPIGGAEARRRPAGRLDHRRDQPRRHRGAGDADRSGARAEGQDRGVDPGGREPAPSPKLRRPGCVDSWLTRGFAGLVGWWFWLRGGQGYRGANEFESAALVGGGFGEGGHLGVGAVVADLVAGEGGQVIEQAAEAAQRVSVGVVTGGRLGLGVGGAVRGGDGVVAGGWVLVGEGHRRPGLAQVPDQVAGQHADQHVGFDPVFEAVVDRAQVEI